MIKITDLTKGRRQKDAWQCKDVIMDQDISVCNSDDLCKVRRQVCVLAVLKHL